MNNAPSQPTPKKGDLSPDWRWRWNGKKWKRAKLTKVEEMELHRLHQINEERTAVQITRRYYDANAFQADASRMAQNGFDIVSTQPLTFYQQGHAFGSLMVIYRRRQEPAMTLYTKQLAPEVRWMRCAACGHTVYEAPSCSYCGAPR